MLSKYLLKFSLTCFAVTRTAMIGCSQDIKRNRSRKVSPWENSGKSTKRICFFFMNLFMNGELLYSMFARPIVLMFFAISSQFFR